MPDVVWSLAGFIVAISVLVCFYEFGPICGVARRRCARAFDRLLFFGGFSA